MATRKVSPRHLERWLWLLLLTIRNASPEGLNHR